MGEITYRACGGCDHIWDGPEEVETDSEGCVRGSVTCSRCGMMRIDHDMWGMR